MGERRVVRAVTAARSGGTTTSGGTASPGAATTSAGTTRPGGTTPPGSKRGAGARKAAALAPLVSGEPLLDVPIAQSRLPGASVLGRVGKRLGVATVRDLLFHLPRRYDDLREMRKLGDLGRVEDGEVISARVTVVDVRVEASFRRRVQRTIAVLEDETGSIEATWFGRRYIERRMHPGQRVIVSGKLKHFGRKRTLDNPDFQPEGNEDELLHVGRIVPVYRLTAGLTAVTLRRSVREALDRAGAAYPEYLPDSLRGEAGVTGIGGAVEEAHFPTSFEARDAALDRLAFDELLALQLGMVGRRRERGRDSARPIAIPDATDVELRGALEGSLGRKLVREVSLTPDQDTAIRDVRSDIARAIPMLRLLQGDVGSGKTAVAAYALAAAAKAGLQGALLAPTDLLARQHHRTLTSLLEDVQLPVELLTGSLTASSARRTLELVASGMAPIVVGTHALLQERVAFAALGLAVIDEQHRFGVEQRGQLEAKAGADGAPHVLLMTATPIPRTLGQVLYADLDVSNLRTPPEGRVPIRTGIRRPDELAGTWQKVREEAAAGHRTFVVVPLIDEAETDEAPVADGAAPHGFWDASAPAAEAEAVRLRELLAPLRVGLVHGRMKAADRDAEMARFRDGELEVLVGTTVVEVGVDVPEATMMIVQGADRFGLAQLHQLRGRVGRGDAASFCVLVSDSVDETAQARLKAVAELHDGFELAERDWELRREGDVLGLVQSGLPRLRVASLQRTDHRDLAVKARASAEAMLDERGELRAGNERLAAEMSKGWLARVAQAAPAGAA
ncbi:MAG TPA: ATP-dependent DNA helicase RecG [Candidatus Limnocylindrales bacterium]|nr:ATP-dependent DNA helicase RecG [Candidatus Limnocylindrales bacterium]